MLHSDRKPPAQYPPLAFHGIRTTSFISASIVTGILSYFCYQLKHDEFKIPWTLLIVIAASIMTLASLLLTILIHSCGALSPIFNLLVNIPLLILWSAAFVLLGWNLYGTLGHTCNAANWGSSDGISVCQTYKALFAFTVIGWCAAVAAIVLDARVRSEQTRLGHYDPMKDGNDGKEWDVKMDNLDRDAAAERANPTGHGARPGMEPYSESQSQSQYGFEQYRSGETQYRDDRRARYGGNESVMMNDFGYQAPSEQTTYNAGHYGYDQDAGPYARGARY